jgi:hypothetical protein
MPRWLFVFLFSSAIVVVSYLTVRYSLKRSDLKPSLKGVAVAVVAALSVLLLSLILDRFGIDLFKGTALFVFQGTAAFLFLGLIVYMILVKMRSGPELADLGPSPMRLVFLGLGISILAIGMGTLISQSPPVGSAIVNLTQGTWMVAMGLARSQIRHRGLYHFGSLVPWDKIAKHEWSEKGVLLIDLRQPRWWQDRLQMPVPARMVQQVDALMRSHVAM